MDSYIVIVRMKGLAMGNIYHSIDETPASWMSWGPDNVYIEIKATKAMNLISDIGENRNNFETWEFSANYTVHLIWTLP